MQNKLSVFENKNCAEYVRDLGIKIIKEGKEILCECPFCHISRKSKKPSLYVKENNGQCFCQNCSYKGNLITLSKDLHVGISLSGFSSENTILGQEIVNKKAEYIWSKSAPTNEHSYLLRKQIKPSISRLYKGCLLVPIYNSRNEIQSLQFIDSEGKKNFLKGGKTRDGYAVIGEVKDRVYIAEGFATASSLYEATGYATVIAFSSHNIEKVVPIIKQKYPDTEIIVCGDTDSHGKEIAEKVAETFGLKITFPVFKDTDIINNKVPTDFNDLFILSGKNEVHKQIHTANRLVSKNVLELKSLTDLLNEPEEKIQWIVDGILPVGGLSLCVAKPKGGKSTLVRQLIISVAKGENFLGRQTEKGTVVHIVLEGLKIELTDHYRRLLGHECENVKVYFGGRPQNAMQWLEKICTEYKPQFLVIDTFFKLLDISDLNDYVKTNKAIEPIFNLSKKYNVHILGIHHARKGGGEDGEATLGSTAIFGAVDTLIYLNKKEGKTTVETIQRYGEKLEPTVLNFIKDTKTFEIGITVAEDKTETVSSDILEYLNLKNTWATEEEICEEISAKTGVKRSALRLLVEQNKIQRKGSGKRGNAYKYANVTVVNELVSEVQSGEELDN